LLRAWWGTKRAILSLFNKLSCGLEIVVSVSTTAAPRTAGAILDQHPDKEENESKERQSAEDNAWNCRWDDFLNYFYKEKDGLLSDGKREH
jgi:hypothetical protein